MKVFCQAPLLKWKEKAVGFPGKISLMMKKCFRSSPSSKLDKPDPPARLPQLLQALSLQQSYYFQSVYGRGGWSKGQGGKLLVWGYMCVPMSVQARALHVLTQCCPPPPSHHPVSATSSIRKSQACSSSHMNAISKTNKNLLLGNLQIKVHFPLKEAHSRVCVCACALRGNSSASPPNRQGMSCHNLT